MYTTLCGGDILHLTRRSILYFHMYRTKERNHIRLWARLHEIKNTQHMLPNFERSCASVATIFISAVRTLSLLQLADVCWFRWKNWQGLFRKLACAAFGTGSLRPWLLRLLHLHKMGR